MRTISSTVGVRQAGQTVQRYLQRTLDMGAGLITHQKQFPGGILRNGQPVRTVDRLDEGDVLSVCLADAPDEGFRFAGRITVPVVREDDDLLVLNKPSGLAVHPATGTDGLTLADLLTAEAADGYVFHPVNRLDKETSGLMVVAKHRYSCDLLCRQLHTEDFCRIYLAVAVGCPSPAAGTISLPITRAPGPGTRRMVSPHGQPAVTHYQTLQQKDGHSLLQLKLETGRTHQIRVHMAALGCPLVGDRLYGTAHPHIDRCALHSAELSLLHPLTGEHLQLTAPLPADIQALL